MVTAASVCRFRPIARPIFFFVFAHLNFSPLVEKDTLPGDDGKASCRIAATAGGSEESDCDGVVGINIAKPQACCYPLTTNH